MSSKNPCRDNGTDNSIDYEEIARRSKAVGLQETYDHHVDETIHEFLQAVEDGDETHQAYLDMCRAMFEFLQEANHDLADLGEFDYSDTENLLLVRSIDVAASTALGRLDLAAEFAVDVAEAVDEASDEDVSEAIAELEESESE
ncbi:hypothetical protein Htur_5286 (plasmid) [Haloterrigena turkmenica DSM 5511]|uniref:Uncharacterized protein n=1 Tax=Haloterrigena turkmenica (strain ATCC 51198 / DSM 5511 / JCM 9101 / NCIMB 13204 / VKM B-1734 / 4k) TaxID=543526 RepID=D2S3R6_HALTV|nr:hypothetical protein [Haloterrigena turkmenica]ADB64013.1 hypothetical protein Htur_5286 [Haloterrigena turkmenica DSM 5511]